MERIQLLVVDDNPDDLELLLRSLQRAAGASILCQTAASCQEALALFDRGEFDCALLDYNLPDVSGPSLIDCIREHFGELPCSIVVLTGMGGERLVVELMKAGAFDYFNKSHYLPEELVHAVEQAAQVTRLRRELAQQSARRAEAEEKLHQAQLLTAELAGVRKAVATFMHEINSPLTGMLNCVDMLLSDEPKPGHEPWLVDMQAACRKMTVVMHKLAELEELRTRPGSGPRGPLDLSGRAGGG